MLGSGIRKAVAWNIGSNQAITNLAKHVAALMKNGLVMQRMAMARLSFVRGEQGAPESIAQRASLHSVDKLQAGGCSPRWDVLWR